jgi:hypothetical protein
MTSGGEPRQDTHVSRSNFQNVALFGNSHHQNCERDRHLAKSVALLPVELRTLMEFNRYVTRGRRRNFENVTSILESQTSRKESVRLCLRLFGNGCSVVGLNHAADLFRSLCADAGHFA